MKNGIIELAKNLKEAGMNYILLTEKDGKVASEVNVTGESPLKKVLSSITDFIMK